MPWLCALQLLTAVLGGDGSVRVQVEVQRYRAGAGVGRAAGGQRRAGQDDAGHAGDQPPARNPRTPGVARRMDARFCRYRSSHPSGRQFPASASSRRLAGRRVTLPFPGRRDAGWPVHVAPAVVRPPPHRGRVALTARGAGTRKLAVLERCTTSSASCCRSGLTRSPRSSAQSRRAPSAPLSSSGWRTVLRPSSAADSMSSNPITDSWPGTVRPHRSAAASTPIAWVSDAAKMADGRSGSASNSAASASAFAGAVRAAPDQRGVVAEACRRQRLAVSGQPVLRRAKPRRWLTSGASCRRRSRSGGGRATAGARWPSARPPRRR